MTTDARAGEAIDKCIEYVRAIEHNESITSLPYRNWETAIQAAKGELAAFRALDAGILDGGAAARAALKSFQEK